jgi:hypothetical protein
MALINGARWHQWETWRWKCHESSAKKPRLSNTDSIGKCTQLNTSVLLFTKLMWKKSVRYLSRKFTSKKMYIKHMRPVRRHLREKCRHFARLVRGNTETGSADRQPRGVASSPRGGRASLCCSAKWWQNCMNKATGNEILLVRDGRTKKESR